VRRTKGRRSISFSVAPNGQLRIAAPALTPLFVIKRLLVSSRQDIRHLLKKATPTFVYEDGAMLGKSHSLQVVTGDSLAVKRHDRVVRVSIPPSETIASPKVQAAIREIVVPILRREAKHYLPRRLEYLAQQYGYSYERVRLSHTTTRWGSCSSSGTISLNIALMRLPFELIDYVLLHELAHTKQMNHSDAFWNLVEQMLPDYKSRRKVLKKYSPIC
jgi:predicted metal-dependent hydrolase